MKVVGFGDNVVDRYGNKQVMFPGGNCVNFAVYAKKNGIDSAYLGSFGDDREARLIKNALKEIGVDTSMCRTEACTVTERCDVNLIDGERVFLQDDERDNIHGALKLTQKELAYLSDFDLIHSGCYAGEEEELEKLAALGKLVAYDFSVEEEYRNDDYLKMVCPNIDFALFSCEGMEKGDIENLLKKVHLLGPQYVLATMGVNGQMIYDGNCFHEGQVETLVPVDTMGAGDSFFTAFLMTLIKEGWTKNNLVDENIIRKAFQTAAKFSAQNCLVNGSFGHEAFYGEADLILRSNSIFTAESNEPVDGFIAIGGNRILAVGERNEMEAFLTEKTKVYDLKDKTVAPGFVDNHVFFTGFVWHRLAANKKAAEQFGFTGIDGAAEENWELFQKFLSDEAFIVAEYQEFQKMLAAKGVTAIKEIGFDDYSGFTEILKKLEDERKLLHRVNLVSQPVAKDIDFEYAELCRQKFTGEFVRFMGFNLMVDGEICSGQGDLVESYENGCIPDQPDYDLIEQNLIKADRLSIRCALHAEGDRAVRRTIDMIEKAMKINGTGDRRHAIIDLELTQKEDIERMAHLGITAINYMQMMNCYPAFDDFYSDYIGEERLKNIWRYQDQVQTGVNYCTGTDLPLDIPDVPASISFTVGRRFPDGEPEEGFNLNQALTVAQVLKAWTANGQYANFEEDRLGTLTAGKLADIAVFDRDIFKEEIEKIREASVQLTIFNGEVVYECQPENSFLQ